MSNKKINTIEHGTLNDGENKENVTLIWFDPNSRSYKRTETIIRELRPINDYIIFCLNLDDCIRRIELIKEEIIFLILSDENALEILSKISRIDQVHSVFILNRETVPATDLLNEYKNIIGVYNNIDDLYQSIKNQIEYVDRHTQTFSFFNTGEILNNDSWKKSALFFWFQIFYRTLNSCQQDAKAKKQYMIEECRKYYDGNTKEMKFIHKFEKTYQAEDAIIWYSKQSFLYKLINKALRTQDTELLYDCQFFISDLFQNLQTEHEKILSAQEKILHFYRGINLSKETFNQLKENQKNLISTNGYFFTSRSKELELSFAFKTTKRTDTVSVLFHIWCDIEEIQKNVIFADVKQLRAHQNQDKVLFDLSACFEIQSIEEDTALCIVNMKVSNQGQQIANDLVEKMKDDTDKMNISLVFGELIAHLDKYDKSLKYFKRLLRNSKDKDRASIEFSIGKVYHLNNELVQARDHYDRAYNLMMRKKPAWIKDSASILQLIAALLYDEKQYDEAIHFYQRVIAIRELFHPSGHFHTAKILNKIGCILRLQEKYNEAYKYHRQALQILETLHSSGDLETTITLRNIGIAFFRQKNYSDAREYFLKAINILEKLYLMGHADIATNLNDIGLSFLNEKKYDEAMRYHQQVVEILEKLHPAGHHETTTSLRNIGIAFFRQKKYSDARDYFLKAIKILENLYPMGHGDIATNLNDIGLTFLKEKKYDEALRYDQQVVEILEKLHPAGHLETTRTLRNIGIAFFRQKKYSDARDYFLRAIKILENLYPTGHADIATNLNDIGLSFLNEKAYHEAVCHHHDAVKILEKLYPSGHLEIATSLHYIGDVHYREQQIALALYYYEQALKIVEKCYPTGYISIGQTLELIGRCYERLANLTKALEYFQASLNIYEQHLPSKQSCIQALYHRIRNVS